MSSMRKCMYICISIHIYTMEVCVYMHHMYNMYSHTHVLVYVCIL